MEKIKKQIEEKSKKVVTWVKAHKAEATAIGITLVGGALLVKSNNKTKEVVEEETKNVMVLELPEFGWFQGTDDNSTWTLEAEVDDDIDEIAKDLLEGKYTMVEL